MTAFIIYYTERLKDFTDDLDNFIIIKTPHDFNFNTIQRLSKEILEILKKQNPKTLSDVKNLSAVTPVAMMLIIKYFKK